jgi:rod shape-determining protein MreD
MKRKIVAVAALAVVLLVQLTIVNGLVLPGGGTPDLVLLFVVVLGMTGGPTAGLLAGFCAGLALDLAPPASQLVGQYALVLCLAGYVAGRLRPALRHSALLALAAAAAVAVAGEGLAAIVTLALDTPEVTLAAVGQMLPPSVLYDVLATPLVMLAAVRLAVALGVSFDPVDDSPALETGGSAAPVTVAGSAGVPGTVSQRMRYRPAVAGGSLAAASGRWLVGDVNDDVPAIGAIGWLAGPARSRRARREQARLTAMVTGASPRKGAFWVGRRPPGVTPGVTPVRPPVLAGPTGLARLRPAAGVAGSAASTARARQGGQARPARPVHLRLADEQRRRSRAAGRNPRAGTGLGAAGVGQLGQHGLDRHALTGPELPSIGFGTGSLPGAGRPAGPKGPRIAFGRGGVAARSLPGAGRDTGRQVPRIAFGTGSLPGAGRDTSRRVPRIAFGTGSLPGGGRAAGRRVPRIAFGGGGVAAGVRPSQPRRAAPRFRAAPSRFASGSWLAGTAVARGGGAGLSIRFGGPLSATGSGHPGAVIGRAARKRKQPRFARAASGYQAARSRQPKTARISAGRGPSRRLGWLRRAGGRSTVWRIGSSRTGGAR